MPSSAGSNDETMLPFGFARPPEGDPTLRGLPPVQPPAPPAPPRPGNSNDETLMPFGGPPSGAHGAVGLPAGMGQAPAPPSDHLVPSVPIPPPGPTALGRLGPYALMRKLGEGGMGLVFVAEDTLLQRSVALKILRPDTTDEEGRQRFLREARATAAVRSPHVITIFQVGEEGGIPYLAMELLQGMTLEAWLQQSPFRPTWAQVLRLGIETARGLSAAHAKGLIHRDIKPANLFLEAPTAEDAASSGGGPPLGRVKILDFGLVRPTTTGGTENVTMMGAILGTPAYIAPEQARGETVDARADLFSLGVVLYRLCTGVSPFDAGSAMSTLTDVVTKEADYGRLDAAGTPPALIDLIRRLLAKDREQRPPTAKAVVDALLAILQTTPGLNVPPSWEAARGAAAPPPAPAPLPPRPGSAPPGALKPGSVPPLKPASTPPGAGPMGWQPGTGPRLPALSAAPSRAPLYGALIIGFLILAVAVGTLVFAQRGSGSGRPGANPPGNAAPNR